MFIITYQNAVKTFFELQNETSMTQKLNSSAVAI